MDSYNDEEELARMHTEETPEGKRLDIEDEKGLSDLAMDYLQQIKELQEQLEEQVRGQQRLEMAILGYKLALEEEMKKGY
tara:strand:- start:466 stop:705 length:240 start_codon:yes stop_codon:yes gene_type:complete